MACGVEASRHRGFSMARLVPYLGELARASLNVALCGAACIGALPGKVSRQGIRPRPRAQCTLLSCVPANPSADAKSRAATGVSQQGPSRSPFTNSTEQRDRLDSSGNPTTHLQAG